MNATEWFASVTAQVMSNASMLLLLRSEVAGKVAGLGRSSEASRSARHGKAECHWLAMFFDNHATDDKISRR